MSVKRLISTTPMSLGNNGIMLEDLEELKPPPGCRQRVISCLHSCCEIDNE